MVNIIDFRLKIRHWFRKYGKVAFTIILAIVIVFILNRYLIYNDDIKVPETTYNPNVSVIKNSSSVPNKVQETAEKMIDEYVEYCNDGNYQKAFNMLSEDCRKYGFDDDVELFAKHVLTKMLTPKKYSIQNYSNYKNYYIYEVKYIDDILATGLTNQEYNFATEKITFTKNKDGSYNMLVGNFINYSRINNISENEYLKIDVIDRITNYSTETYKVKFSNRTDSTVVIADNFGGNEVRLVLPQEYRNLNNAYETIILAPGGSKTCDLVFQKFFDDGDDSQALNFSAVRVIENYKGEYDTEEEAKNEIDNAIAKFSVEIPVQ